MAAPLVVVIPHSLGAAEARRRLEGGLDNLRTQFSAQLTRSEIAWAGNDAQVHLAALGQSIDARLEVPRTEIGEHGSNQGLADLRFGIGLLHQLITAGGAEGT